MLRNLTGSLLEHEAIRTTVPRAKELRRYAEKVITLGKHGNELEVRKVLYQENLVRKLMFDIAPRFADRQGGYTRILKCGPRQSDQAEMAVIELVGRVGELRPKDDGAKSTESKTKKANDEEPKTQ